MKPLSNDFVKFSDLERVESNELGNSGMVRFGVVDNEGNVFDFETAEKMKARDAAETILSCSEGDYPAVEEQADPLQKSHP